MASPDGNPRPLGTIKDIFRRQYILFNPNRFTGPDTWRLNLPAEVRCVGEDPCTSESILKTIVPIVHFEDARNYEVYFIINSLPSVITRQARKRRLGVLAIPPVWERATNHCDIESITAFPPMFSMDSAGNAHLTFKINPLDPLPSIRTSRNNISYNVGSRLVSSVTADAPVMSETVGLETTLSFDIDQLNSLP